jgi:CubicO group peptidase (beta-lactamase class C family)
MPHRPRHARNILKGDKRFLYFAPTSTDHRWVMHSRRTFLLGSGAVVLTSACRPLRDIAAHKSTELIGAPASTVALPQDAANRWDLDALKSAAEFARVNKSEAFTVMINGAVVLDERWAGDDPRRDVASVQKSVISTLVGQAIDRSLFTVNTPVSKVLGNKWSKATKKQEGAITIGHLLSMTSGLNDSLRFDKKPGTKWAYNSIAFGVLHDVLARAAKMSLNDLSQAWLFAPLGMTAQWIDRRGIAKVAPHGLVTSARDLATYGQLMLQRGQWNGTQLVNANYLAAATATSQPLNASYGYLWWLNGKASFIEPSGTKTVGQLFPSAPADLFAALGYEDQKIYVVPSENMVVTRIGTAAKGKSEAMSGFDDELWAQIMKARRA